jgi:hypothetical protein
MRSTRSRRFAAAAAAALLLGAAAGCSTTYTLEEAEMEAQAEAALAPQFDGKGPTIDCPGSVTAEVGGTATCTATLDGQSAPALITITSVDDDGNVKFDVEIQGEDSAAGEESAAPDGGASAPSQ